MGDHDYNLTTTEVTCNQTDVFHTDARDDESLFLKIGVVLSAITASLLTFVAITKITKFRSDVTLLNIFHVTLMQFLYMIAILVTREIYTKRKHYGKLIYSDPTRISCILHFERSLLVGMMAVFLGLLQCDVYLKALSPEEMYTKYQRIFKVFITPTVYVLGLAIGGFMFIICNGDYLYSYLVVLLVTSALYFVILLCTVVLCVMHWLKGVPEGATTGLNVLCIYVIFWCPFFSVYSSAFAMSRQSWVPQMTGKLALVGISSPIAAFVYLCACNARFRDGLRNICRKGEEIESQEMTRLNSE